MSDAKSRVLLLVTGGIAAYKACDLVSRLKKRGAQVRVVLTKHACEFVPPLTFETLSGNPAYTDAFDRKFDAIMVYNAFPHFPDPEALIRVLAELVEPGGRLSIAHGMSRAQLRQHHAGRASEVSIDLLHEKDLAALLAPYFDVDVVISNHRMYQVAGTRREGTIHSHGGHSHAHAHSDVHDHSHHGGHSHCDSDTPMEELLALMKYMVTHNDTHAQEMAELAMKIRDAGKHRAYEKIMDAVADFDILNAKFDAVLKELTQ